jgi:hypothetical protein
VPDYILLTDEEIIEQTVHPSSRVNIANNLLILVLVLFINVLLLALIGFIRLDLMFLLGLLSAVLWIGSLPTWIAFLLTCRRGLKGNNNIYVFTTRGLFFIERLGDKINSTCVPYGLIKGTRCLLKAPLFGHVGDVYLKAPDLSTEEIEINHVDNPEKICDYLTGKSSNFPDSSCDFKAVSIPENLDLKGILRPEEKVLYLRRPSIKSKTRLVLFVSLFFVVYYVLGIFLYSPKSLLDFLSSSLILISLVSNFSSGSLPENVPSALKMTFLLFLPVLFIFFGEISTMRLKIYIFTNQGIYKLNKENRCIENIRYKEIKEVSLFRNRHLGTGDIRISLRDSINPLFLEAVENPMELITSIKNGQ